ncbi:MAG: radical SAM protein [Clostridiaceae bacterium]|nr:radical SAM protein [Clostridiaceae bacterium]
MKYSSQLESCNLCNRHCNVNRLIGKTGFCNADDKITVARAELHLWEEPPISLGKGSGAVFFSHCNLRCVFCQNHEISQENKGLEITIDRLSEIFLELQDKGANNINLVTPTHYVPQIKEAIDLARKNGLKLPILYNTNGCDTVETIQSLNGYIDVYLPDFKYFDDKYGIKYSKINNYKEDILPVLIEMFKQVGKPVFDDKGRIIKGMIIRHLMLPGLLFDSKKVIDTIYKTFGDNVYVSIMNQYIPMFNACNYPEINKRLNPKHYESLINYVTSIGITKGFIQDQESASTEFVPNFNFQGI